MDTEGKTDTSGLGTKCFRMAVQEAKKIDITQHILVPKHILLKPEEVSEVLEQFNISILQLPTVLATDSMVKIVGAKVGDVVKIDRAGPSGQTAYYRRVV